MYPVGHFSFALFFRKKSRGFLFLLFCFFLTILPDFDFLLGFTHRTFTHSLLFALIVGLIISRKNWFYFFSIIASHPMIDMLCHDEPRNGVMLFWPFWNHYVIFPFHPFYATPILQSLSTEFFILISFFALRETWDAITNFILD